MLPNARNELVAVTREDVRCRARELAALRGRAPHEVTQSDYEQARRELTGETDFDRQEAKLERGADPAARMNGSALQHA